MEVDHAMEAKTAPSRQSWWARLSSRMKLLLVAIVILVIIGLAVGLGVGLTVGNNNGGGEESQPTETPTITPTATNLPKTVYQPAVAAPWQIILQNPLELSNDATSLAPDVGIWDIDLFTNSKDIIDTLHRLGKKVICYFSAGSYEPGRPDSDQFQQSDKGKELVGWPGEYWLNLNSSNVKAIMAKRIQLASEKGCDGIDPDNVDGYVSRTSLQFGECERALTSSRTIRTGLTLRKTTPSNSSSIFLQLQPPLTFPWA
jgi:hypothetical protein